MKSILTEGLERGDLKRLIHNELHIDEFQSKMGTDEDILVLSFKVRGKEPALDLVNFVEKGYPWVLDADVSSGEMDDGDYIVFVECEREPEVAEQIVKLIQNILNLTEQDMTEWRFQYRGRGSDHSVTADDIREIVPLTPEQYKKRHNKSDIDQLKSAAGVKVNTEAPKNEFTESLRIAAGIR